MCGFLLAGGQRSRRPSPGQFRGPLLAVALHLGGRLPLPRLRPSLKRALAQSAAPWVRAVPWSDP